MNFRTAKIISSFISFFRQPECAMSKAKTRFSVEEDYKLIMLVSTFGVTNWKLIAEKMEKRTIRQCKERWVNYLQPGLNNNPWTRAEDLMLIEKVKLYGNSWAKIKQFFPRRTDINIKNRWSKISHIDYSSGPEKEEPSVTISQENQPDLFDSTFDELVPSGISGFDIWPQLDEI